eukprot:11080538-Alexandrium_andersonii.AAC.1
MTSSPQRPSGGRLPRAPTPMPWPGPSCVARATVSMRRRPPRRRTVPLARSLPRAPPDALPKCKAVLALEAALGCQGGLCTGAALLPFRSSAAETCVPRAQGCD